MLKATPLCEADIRLQDPLVLGASPWRSRRISYILGGTIDGERLRGQVLAGGGDWADMARSAAGEVLTLMDVRSVWQTHDGAKIAVSYSGRLVIPTESLKLFREPGGWDAVSEDRYYFRTQPTFETDDARYAWLNGRVAVGYGKVTSRGVRYRVFTLD